MTNNQLAFTGLCNEYCTVMNNPLTLPVTEFVERMLKLLPRLYICALDLQGGVKMEETEGWVDFAMSEEEYEHARNAIAALLGPHDVYLEVFEEDMKYSDTPVSASVSENLADIYQVLYNYLDTVRMGTDETVESAIAAVSESFAEYWSTTLCNVLRALNNLRFQGLLHDDQASDNNSMD